MEIKDILKQIGLREEEIKVFEKCAKGFFRASEIAESVKLKRTHVYAILDSLIEKELIVEVTSGKVKQFHSVSISRIYDYIEKQKLELEDEKKELDEALSELKEKYSIKRRANVEFYNGVEEVKKFYLKVNDNRGNEEVKIISKFFRYAMVGDAIDKLNELKNKRYEELGDNIVKAKSIVPNTQKSKDIIRYQLSKHDCYLKTNDYKLVDFHDIPIDNTIVIRPNDVSIFAMTETETWAMRFFEESVRNTFNGIFEALWTQGELFNDTNIQ